MKRVFISMPMKGKSDEEVYQDMEKAKTRVKELWGDSIQILDSICKDYDSNKGRGQFVRFSIKLLATADALYVCRGWERAPGCALEVECATHFDMQIAFEQ